MIVSGTCPSSSECIMAVLEQIYDSNSRAWSHSFLGLLALAALRPVPFFNSWIASSATFCQGKCSSVCLMWVPISLAFLRKSPIVCSLEPSMMICRGTPSHCPSNERPSWASALLLIGKTLDQPNLVAKICAYQFCQNHDGTGDSSVSMKTSCMSLQYRSCRSLVQNLLDSVL